MSATTPLSHSRGTRLLPVACAIAVVGMAMAFERWPTAGFEGYAMRAKRELVLGRDLITKRNAAFLQMGLLKMSPRFCEPHQLSASSPTALGLFGQACPEPSAELLGQDMPPSTSLLPPADETLPEGITVISLVCPSDQLFDEKHGIITNPMEMGRTSERPAWLSGRLGSKIVVESPIGLRVHGGSSRASPHKSFSLVFREEYGGHDRSEPGLFFGADTPAANHIVLVNAAHPSRFAAALGTEIAAAFGCNTSRLTPAIVFLNGTQIRSPFFLYQHQSPDLVKSRFQLADIDWVRLKANRERENPAYVSWRQWIRKERFPTLLSDEARRYDIKDLNAWALAISFTSTADNHQGAFFRDRSRSDGRWKSFVWDFDCAFYDDPHPTGFGPFMNVEDPIKTLIGDRARLFHRLMERTPEYRDQFRKYVHEALMNVVTQEKLMALVDRYERLAQEHPMASAEVRNEMTRARQFLTNRHEFYLAYLDRSLRAFEEAGLAIEAARAAGVAGVAGAN